MRKIFGAFFVLFLSATASAHAVIYTGTLTSPPPSGITTSNPGGAWEDNIMFKWKVEDTFGDWLYTYTITDLAGGRLGADPGTQGGISHVLFEISETATEADFYDFKFDADTGVMHSIPSGSVEFGEFGDEGNSNPDIPALINGIKITGAAKTYSFFSTKAPVWGNFYTKDGKAGGGDNTAWNTDFLLNVDNTDPANFASTICPTGGECYLPDPSGGIFYKILRPDSIGGGGGGGPTVPEPSTFFLLGSGVLGFLGRRKKHS